MYERAQQGVSRLGKAWSTGIRAGAFGLLVVRSHAKVLSSGGCNQPILGKSCTSLLPPRGSRTTSYLPSLPKKCRELGCLW